LRAVASPRLLERFNYLNPRVESAALGRGLPRHAPHKRAPSLAGRFARAATDFGICLELSGQVIASHGFFMTARKSCGTRENRRSAFGSRRCHLFAPRVAFAQQVDREVMALSTARHELPERAAGTTALAA
jgi:hypothetical protein